MEYLLVADYAASRNDFGFLDDNGTEYNPADDVRAERENSDFSSGSVLGKWGYGRSQSWRFGLQQSLYWKRQGIPGIGNNQSRHARLNTFRSITEGRASSPVRERGVSTSQRLVFTHESESFIDEHGEVGVGRQHNLYRTQTAEWRSRVQAAPFGGPDVTLGTSVRRETFRPEERLGRNPQLSESARWAASAKLAVDTSLPRGWGVVSGSAGLEHDRSHVFEVTTLPISTLEPDTTYRRTLRTVRGGLRLDLASFLFLKANIGRSQRSPSFFELFGDRGGVVGNTGLVPEEALTWDAGVRLQTDGGAVLEFVYYHHSYEDLIQFVQNSQGVSRAANIGRARVRGLEATLGLTVSRRWTASANYTLQKARDRSKVPHQRNRLLPNRATHEGNVHADCRIGPATVFYDYAFEDGSYLDRANLRPVPTRHIHNAGIRWALYRGVQATIEAKNLRDSQVADVWGYPLPGRSLFVTVKEDF